MQMNMWVQTLVSVQWWIPTSKLSDFTRRQPSGGPLVPSSPLRPEVLRRHEK
jgi:hypothetical protein